jgi:hypothetical protein
MNAKRKSKNTKLQTTIPYKEVDFYRDKFAEWLTDKAGKEARSAFFALWAIEVFSRVNISMFDKEVARARSTLQKFLRHTYKSD